MAAIIRTEDLQKVFGRHVRALDGVSLSVEEGEYVTVTGRSGSGKSTLMNIIGCLDQPTGGTVEIAGQRVNYSDPGQLVSLRRSKIGFIFQQFSLIPSMTAAENIEYPLIFSGVPGAERKRRTMEMLELVGIRDRSDHLPGELSGGQQQRVAISRALVAGPELVLADEPTGNLDSTTSNEIISLLKRINEEMGTTFLIVTHEPSIWLGTDRTIHLSDGKVVQ